MKSIKYFKYLKRRFIGKFSGSPFQNLLPALKNIAGVLRKGCSPDGLHIGVMIYVGLMMAVMNYEPSQSTLDSQIQSHRCTTKFLFCLNQSESYFTTDVLSARLFWYQATFCKPNPIFFSFTESTSDIYGFLVWGSPCDERIGV
jgi:hypothetical protein